jgi:hypothetical protein
MSDDKIRLGKTLMWGGLTAVLYWGLFQYAGEFLRLAHTTLDACAVNQSAHTLYFNKVTPELCTQQKGSFIEGQWWYVLAPIAMAFVLSYTHGNFTSLFWEVIGLKARN